mgnify:FL=1|jgi:hypothetical protein
MSNINPSETIGTNQPFFETIFTKHKKVFFALPIIAVALILTLYFTSDPNKENLSENNVDVSLPGAETKELSDSKLDVISDFDKLNEEKEKQVQESENYTPENMNPDAAIPTETYQKPDDEVVKKVNKMLGEMEKQKKVKNSSNARRSYSENSYSSTDVNQSNDNNSATTQENFDSFFSSKTRSNNVTSSQQQKSDLSFFASIKGDHLGLRNNQRVTLILSKDIEINGKVFKKNTLLYAQATFNESRVNLSINNISQIPMSIKAYDAEDGNLGLQVKESLMAETTSEAISDATDEIDVNGIPLGNTVKKLFKRKRQIPKIDLLNNQKLVLKLDR